MGRHRARSCGSAAAVFHGQEPWHDTRQHAVHRAPAQNSWWEPCQRPARCDVKDDTPPPWLGWPTPGPSQDPLSLKMRQARTQGHVDWQRWSRESDLAARRPRSSSPQHHQRPRRLRWPNCAAHVGPQCPNYGMAVAGRRGRVIRWPQADGETGCGPQPAVERVDGSVQGFLDQLHHAFVQLTGGYDGPGLAAPTAAVVDLLDRRWWDLPPAMRPGWWEIRARLEKSALTQPYILWADFVAMLKLVLPSVAGTAKAFGSTFEPTDVSWGASFRYPTEEEYDHEEEEELARPPPVASQPPRFGLADGSHGLQRVTAGVAAAAAATVREEWEARLQALLRSIDWPHSSPFPPSSTHGVQGCVAPMYGAVQPSRPESSDVSSSAVAISAASFGVEDRSRWSTSAAGAAFAGEEESASRQRVGLLAAPGAAGPEPACVEASAHGDVQSPSSLGACVHDAISDRVLQQQMPDPGLLSAAEEVRAKLEALRQKTRSAVDALEHPCRPRADTQAGALAEPDQG